MGKLFDAKQRIDEVIAQKGLDPVQTRGAIGLKAGTLMGLIMQSTPDDDAKLKRLVDAAKEILKVDITGKS
jgi:hypothetical protein